MKNFVLLAVLCLLGLNAMAQPNPPVVFKSYAFYPGKWVNNELTYPKTPEKKEFLFLLFDEHLQMNDRDETRFYFTTSVETEKGVADDGDPFFAIIGDAISSKSEKVSVQIVFYDSGAQYVSFYYPKAAMVFKYWCHVVDRDSY